MRARLLKFTKRPSRSENAVQILPPKDPPLKRLVSSLLQKSSDLPRVLKTKKYILARLEGDGVSVAKKKAGFLHSVDTNKAILSSPMAKALLDELVKDKIPDPEVATRLREMWDARKTTVRFKKSGETEMVDLGPDFEKQKYAMDKRLALGGYNNGSLPESREQNVVTQIQFTTINVDAREEK